MSTYSPCEPCAAPCCRTRTVVLDGYDAYRIAGALQLPYESFIDMPWLEEPDAEHAIALIADRETGERRWHSLVLRKVPDPDPAFRYRCVFLAGYGARGRCNVYPARPGSCAAFPTELRGGLVVIAGDEVCPPHSWDVSMIDLARHRALHLRRQLRAAIHDALVEQWNELVEADPDGRDATAFFNFLHNLHRALDRRDPAILDGREAPPVMLEGGAARALVEETLREIGWVPPALAPRIRVAPAPPTSRA